jgi:cellulose synthase/poly-beta-1,6-N-acetylglucosamine synthase-like glycosyltransferase
MRIDEIILVVDSDTVVPEDCLRGAARETAEPPEVAIIQHESGELLNPIQSPLLFHTLVWLTQSRPLRCYAGCPSLLRDRPRVFRS